jgi:hypothetical protein
MQAVMPAGRPSTPTQNHLVWLCVGGAMLMALACPCFAQTGSIDQIERLLQLQQALQQQHAQQLSTLQLQLQEQERASATQDWQWALTFALGLFGLALAAWVAKQWQIRRAQGATNEERLFRRYRANIYAPPVIDTAEPVFGSLSRKAALDPEDDMDSQLLADEALREFELRRTVGLMPATPAEPTAVQPPPQAQIDQAWEEMREVSLDSDTHPADQDTPANAVDVSIEVQKVRKHLHLRRMERTQVASPTNPLTHEASLPAETAASAPLEPVITPMPAPASPTLTLPQPHASSAELIFPASQRGMSEMEIRLALAQEFRRLGQIAEAEQLCNEALHAGNATEQHSARQLLESLPGR